MLKKCIVATACLLATLAHAEEVRIPITTGGEILLTMPDGWQSKQDEGKTPTLSFGPSTGSAFMVMVSTLVLPDGHIGPTNMAQIRVMLGVHWQQVKGRAVEPALEVEELHSATANGAYFTATDKAPPAGEFKYLTQGEVVVDDVPVSFTILTNDDSRAAAALTLKMIEGARRK